MESWKEKCQNIDAVLSDITGVLYDGGAGVGTQISGSIEAIERLKSSGIPLRFCTNETTCTKNEIAAKLNKLGFSMRPEEIFAPIPAACGILTQRGLRPHLLVTPEVLADFSAIEQTNPNCVVLGDAQDHFSYTNLNKAFQILVSLKNPVLISLGAGKYYKGAGGLVLDVGSYAKALEFACDVQAEVVGKPSPAFFHQALNDIGVTPDKAVMIGDDIVNDVGGAQACGLLGIQVRTGKYRPCDEPHPTVKPDAYVDNLAQFVDIFLEHKVVG